MTQRGNTQQKGLTKVSHVAIDSYIYRKRHDPVTVFGILGSIVSKLSSPKVIGKYRKIAAVSSDITALLDDTMIINRVIALDIGRMRYLEHKLIEQFVVLADCVNPACAVEAEAHEGTDLIIALADLSACIQSIQKWIDLTRGVPSLHLLNSHAIHHTEQQNKRVKSGTHRVFFSVIANALVSVATNPRVVKNYRNILARQALVLAAWAGIIDRINSKHLMEAAENVAYKDIERITTTVNSLIQERNAVMHSKNTMRSLVTTFLIPTLDISTLMLKPGIFANTPLGKNRIKTLCDPHFLAILNLAESSHALDAIEDMYEDYPTLKMLYRDQVYMAKSICETLCEISRKLKRGYCIKSIVRMEARSALEKYVHTITNILHKHAANPLVIVPDNFKDLLRKTSIYCFYSDVICLRDSPGTPEDIATFLEDDNNEFFFSKSLIDNDIAYVDVGAFLSMGCFSTRAIRKGVDHSPGTTSNADGAPELGTNLDSLSAHTNIGLERSSPPPYSTHNIQTSGL